MQKLEKLRRADDGDPFNAGWNACLDEVLCALKPERDIRVAFEGDNLDQIRDGCMTVARAIRATPKSKLAEYRMTEREKMKRNRENREVLRRAFNLIRNDPAQKSVVNDLAKALGGDSALADDLLASAYQIIANYQ